MGRLAIAALRSQMKPFIRLVIRLSHEGVVRPQAPCGRSGHFGSEPLVPGARGPPSRQDPACFASKFTPLMR